MLWQRCGGHIYYLLQHTHRSLIYYFGGGNITPWYICECQKETCRNWFLPPIMWISGIKLKSQKLAKSTRTHWTTSLALHLIFWNRFSHELWSLTFWSKWLSIVLPGSACLCSPRAGIVDVYCLTFMWVLGIELGSLCFYSKYFIHWSYLPRLQMPHFKCLITTWG